MPHLVILKFSVMLFAIIVVFNARLAKINLLWAQNFKDYLNLHGRFQKKLATVTNDLSQRVQEGDKLYLESFAGALPLPPYVALPKLNGTYRYLIICLIWRFMVITKRTMKYSRRMGQNTGTSNILKNVMPMAVSTDRVQECQNLNSGSLLAKGLDKKNNDM